MTSEILGQEPVPHLTIQPSRGWRAMNMAEIWHARELLWFFTLRDMKIRYKQSALGPLWIVLLPLATSGLFSLIFGVFAGLPSGRIPYPLFVFSGVLVWNLFSRSLAFTAASLTSNQALLTKVYFPRLILPVATTCGALLDFAFGFVVLLVLMFAAGLTPGWAFMALPLFITLAMLTGMGVGLWIAALGVRFRDLTYSTQFLTQFWMWATPVAYSGQLLLDNDRIPAAWQPVLTTLFQLNPAYLVVEGFRWSLFGDGVGPPGMLSLGGLVLTAVLLFGGIVVFRSTEHYFADVV